MNKFHGSLPSLLLIGLVGLSACTDGNPQVAMCQSVTKQLTNNTVSSWDSDSKDGDDRAVQIKVNFTNTSGQVGSTICTYPKHENGNIDTAPSRVTMNNQRVDQQVLLQAGTAASKELITGAYKNTVARTTELAGQASEKSRELASQAKDATVQGAKALQDLQQK